MRQLLEMLLRLMLVLFAVLFRKRLNSLLSQPIYCAKIANRSRKVCAPHTLHTARKNYEPKAMKFVARRYLSRCQGQNVAERAQLRTGVGADMNAAEFTDAQAQGDRRAGRCPFCGEPGWITGDGAWCAHYAGTYDTIGASVSCYPFLEQEPFRRFAKAVAQIAAATEPEQVTMLQGISPRSRRLVTAALTYPDPIDFWQDFIPYEVLFMETDEVVFRTTYISLFVADLERAKQRLATMVQQALGELDDGADALVLYSGV